MCRSKQVGSRTPDRNPRFSANADFTLDFGAIFIEPEVLKTHPIHCKFTTSDKRVYLSPVFSHFL
jgi:hypothetical protein